VDHALFHKARSCAPMSGLVLLQDEPRHVYCWKRASLDLTKQPEVGKLSFGSGDLRVHNTEVPLHSVQSEVFLACNHSVALDSRIGAQVSLEAEGPHIIIG